MITRTVLIIWFYFHSESDVIAAIAGVVVSFVIGLAIIGFTVYLHCAKEGMLSIIFFAGIVAISPAYPHNGGHHHNNTVGARPVELEFVLGSRFQNKDT